jgi:multicomponent Na+:H+ antiporter subunit E
MIKKFYLLLSFVIFYIKEVIVTNFIVANEVLTPTHHMKPGFICIDVGALSDRQLLIFCNLLTMTPGSIVVDVSQDKTKVTVHILYLEDEASAIAEINDCYLKRVKEIF